MSETYTNKYNMVFHENANCTVINDAHYHAPVTIISGKTHGTTPTSEKIKAAIEKLEEEELLVNGTHWWAIYRVLTAKFNYPRNKTDFCKVIEKLNVNVKTKCVYDLWRRVTTTHLNGDPDTWGALTESLSPAEQGQLRVAVTLMRLLE